MPVAHHSKIDPSIIRSSNEVHSASSPTILVSHSKLNYDDVPAGVGQRSEVINEIAPFRREQFQSRKIARYHVSYEDGTKSGSNHQDSGKSSANARKPKFDSEHSDQWRHRVKEDENAKADRFSKLRTDHRAMKDGEKRAQAASMVKVNHEKINGALPISARPYATVPPAPPVVTSELPDAWYAEHRRQLKEEHLLKEQQRQTELANEKVESNNSFGFKVMRALSNTGAKLEHTAASASKGSQNKAIEHYEMQAHQRLAKYWPNLSAERFICSFDVEVLHEDYPISGYVILTEKTLCFCGKGSIRQEPDWQVEGDSSPLAHNESMASRFTTNSSISKRSTNSSFLGTTHNSSFFASGDEHKQDKQHVTILHTLPFSNILSYSHGVVLKCKDKHKTFVAAIPRGAEAQMKPNALLLFAKDGFVYQFRHFRSMSMTASLLKDGHHDTAYDRFVNYFDHAWRAEGNSHQDYQANAAIVPL